MGRCKMDRSNIEKISQDPEDRLLLAKIWDKIQNGMRRNIPAATGFLSPREQEMAKYLFGQQAEQLVLAGGQMQLFTVKKCTAGGIDDFELAVYKNGVSM